jgi:hypothetical protein
MDASPYTPQQMLDAIAAACQKVTSSDGARVQCSIEPTAYILPGARLIMHTPHKSYVIWLGVAATALHLVANFQGLSPYRASLAFKGCFERAAHDGWQVSYEAIDPDTVVMAARCALADSGVSVKADMADKALNTAAMVQSWLHCCQRQAIHCSTRPPMPI